MLIRRTCPPKSRTRQLLVDQRLVVRFWTDDLGDGAMDFPEDVWAHLGMALLNPWAVATQVMTRADDPGELHDHALVYLKVLQGNQNLCFVKNPLTSPAMYGFWRCWICSWCRCVLSLNRLMASWGSPFIPNFCKTSSQASGDFRVLHRLIDLVDTAAAWQLRFYELVSDKRGVGRFIAGVVPVKAHPDSGGQVWPPMSVRKPRAPSSKGHAPSSGSHGAGPTSGSERPSSSTSPKPLADAPPPSDEFLVDAAVDDEPDGGDDQPDVFDAGCAPIDDLVRLLHEAGGIGGEPDEPAEGVLAGDDGDGEATPAQAASSSGPVVPADGAAPPSPRVASSQRAIGTRTQALVTVRFEAGTIAYYPASGIFQATCLNPWHGRCVLTRSVPGVASAKPRRAVLGLLAHWVTNNDQSDKAGHWTREALQPSRADRAAALQFLHLVEGGPALFPHEGEKRAGDDSEPEFVH